MKEVIYCADCFTNENFQITLKNGQVVSMAKVDSHDRKVLYMAPGLFDIQINGFLHTDFNSFPILENDFLKVIDQMSKQGVLFFLPTVITNSDSNMISLLENINELCLKNPVIQSYVAGIHLEGPFISPDSQARGAHDGAHVKAPDWELFTAFQKASGNRIKLVTLSPEWENSVEFIKKCVQDNVKVALGHTMATDEQIEEAVLAGASLSTHLGNGAPLFLSRNKNIIYDQLANDLLVPSLITDGFHLPVNFIKTVLKVKKNQIILVSDATMFAGMAPGVYNSHIGGKVRLDGKGRLSLYEHKELLAGSAASLLDCINFLLKQGLSTFEEAWEMASNIPYKLMYPERENTDLVLFGLADGEIVIHSAFKSGKRVYKKY
ncbi:N-acetylglucosamine-6-phosphate deacetylase [Galbibacter pacificus]|uniref:N-acetylglucosamine-6-phosphate deacetylase n=1 Tax=Galbibacter pacificus TaxID=2996052 RepID=A0ABT6FNB4_9FLAO|nr:hypothetical protein [Galbibacter pacificus]MDG3581184.1 hypothetical protein [Galbibacter pacificus]MDG3584662.1 hypothetical protein [Galbibacter pacificus]